MRSASWKLCTTAARYVVTSGADGSAAAVLAALSSIVVDMRESS